MGISVPGEDLCNGVLEAQSNEDDYLTPHIAPPCPHHELALIQRPENGATTPFLALQFAQRLHQRQTERHR